jgi:hypothetical protein
MSLLRLTEIAYLAGIIDGEGCIMLQRQDGSFSICPILSIANTNLDLIDWLKTRLGGSIGCNPRANSGCKDVYQWHVMANNAVELLKQVRPFLRIKGKQADAVIALWEENAAALALTGRKAFGHGNSIPVWLRHFRSALYYYVRDLNRRGPGGLKYVKEARFHLQACAFEEAKLCH